MSLEIKRFLPRIETSRIVSRQRAVRLRISDALAASNNACWPRRYWAAERTAFAREVAEMALAHAIPDAVEAAYRRGDLFDKRRKLMAAWAEYCAKIETDARKVVALSRARTPQ